MSLKYTPGPWKYNIKRENGYYQLSGENGSQIGRLWGNKHTEANAHLIAASPEMLEIIISDLRINLKFISFRDITFMRQETNSKFNKKIDIVEKATGMTIEEVLNVTD